jgi:hypothetical protein
MTNGKNLWLTFVTFGASLALSGCLLEKKEDVERFRQALPKSENVEVSGPESSQGQQSAAIHVQANEPWASGPWAKYYGFTRTVRDGVNVVTGTVLGWAWAIVHLEPTSVEDKQAIWGPYTDALEPASWRFRVTEVGENEYEYRLEGRPKASQSDADYRSVLIGTGFGKGHASHGDGAFTIDLDVAKSLDPFYLDDDSGKITVTHDLPPNITSKLGALPRTIQATLTPSATDAWFSVTSIANEDRTGTLLVNAHADADDSNATAKEDIQIASQWNAHGEGRADITLSGGDIPAVPGVVTAVECWGSDFFRVYYSDSINWEATEGDASTCAYAQPLAP